MPIFIALPLAILALLGAFYFILGGWFHFVLLSAVAA